MNVIASIFAGVLLLLLTACRSTPLESTAATLNRDLDLTKSLYQYKISEDKQRLMLVLRKMPVGKTAADATLQADVEKVIASKIGVQPNVVEIRVFETRPDLRREAWVVEFENRKLAFDVIFRASSPGQIDFTVEGPMTIEGAL
jgi:hypothetical protein